MAYDIVPGRRTQEVHERINQYHYVRFGNYDAMVRMLGLDPHKDTSLVAERMRVVWDRMYPTYVDGRDMLQRLFEATMLAGSPGAPNYIGNAEYGISQA